MKFLVMMHSSPKRGIRNSRIKMSSYGSDEILFIDSFVSCITVELADFMAGKLVCCALKLSENTERGTALLSFFFLFYYYYNYYEKSLLTPFIPLAMLMMMHCALVPIKLRGCVLR